MVAIALGLAASVSWGVADFIGGIQSRRMPVVAVVLGSQLAGLVLVVVIVAARGTSPPGGDFVLYAALSSVAGIIGLTSFYKALSIGAMGVVAPLSSTAAVIPVAVGIATGDRPSALQGIGVAIAIGGVILASREATDEAQNSPAISRGAGFALISAVGFGCFFLLDRPRQRLRRPLGRDREPHDLGAAAHRRPPDHPADARPQAHRHAHAGDRRACSTSPPTGSSP